MYHTWNSFPIVKIFIPISKKFYLLILPKTITGPLTIFIQYLRQFSLSKPRVWPYLYSNICMYYEESELLPYKILFIAHFVTVLFYKRARVQLQNPWQAKLITRERKSKFNISNSESFFQFWSIPTISRFRATFQLICTFLEIYRYIFVHNFALFQLFWPLNCFQTFFEF